MTDVPARFKPRLCLACGYPIDAGALTVGGLAPPPSDGDVAICLNCGHVMLFAGDSVREPNAEETAEIMAEPDIIEARAHIRALERARPSYWCEICHQRSYNLNDVKNRYCGFCHAFEADRRPS